jgi:effector-binding domain-containing protein
VVIPCCEEGKANAKKMAAMELARMLLPLKTQPGWEIEAAENSLKVKHEEYGIDGALTFDPESHLLVEAKYKGKMHDREGEFVIKYSDPKEFCGAKMASRWVTTFAGKPWMTDQILEMACGPVDDGLFEQPEQVADGTFVEKTTPAGAAACIKHKGPYENINASIKKLTGLMGKQKLAPMGPVMMTYLKGPPKVKKSKKFVTEVCVPVSVKKPPKRPKKKGKLTLKSMKPMSVLAVYGSGDYQKKSGELMKALVDEAKKRKLKTKGPVSGVYYMDPESTPADQQVAEMMIPIKGGKKKPKTVKKAKKMQKKVIKPIKKTP